MLALPPTRDAGGISRVRSKIESLGERTSNGCAEDVSSAITRPMAPVRGAIFTRARAVLLAGGSSPATYERRADWRTAATCRKFAGENFSEARSRRSCSDGC